MHIYGADAYVQHICRDIHWPCTIPVTQVTHMACPPGQPRWLEEGSDSGEDNNLPSEASGTPPDFEWVRNEHVFHLQKARCQT